MIRIIYLFSSGFRRWQVGKCTNGPALVNKHYLPSSRSLSCNHAQNFYDIIAMITKHIVHFMNSSDIQLILTEVWITYYILCYIMVRRASNPGNRLYSKACSLYVSVNISMHENMRHLWPKSAKYYSKISFWCWITIGLHNRNILSTNSGMKKCESYKKFCGIIVHISYWWLFSINLHSCLAPILDKTLTKPYTIRCAKVHH